MADTPTPPGGLRSAPAQRRPVPKGLTPYKPGQSGNPGGVSKERRAFLAKLQGEDAQEIYDAFMALVRAGNERAILRGLEYVAGKPDLAEGDREALKEALTVVVQQLRVGPGGEVVDVETVQPGDGDGEETT